MSRSRLRPTLLLSDREARPNRRKLATVIDLDLGLALVAEGASYDQRLLLPSIMTPKSATRSQGSRTRRVMIKSPPRTRRHTMVAVEVVRPACESHRALATRDNSTAKRVPRTLCSSPSDGWHYQHWSVYIMPDFERVFAVAKVRVYELAKELGVDSSTLLFLLKAPLAKM